MVECYQKFIHRYYDSNISNLVGGKTYDIKFNPAMSKYIQYHNDHPY